MWVVCACTPALWGLRQANHSREFQNSLVYRLRSSVSKHTARVIYINITFMDRAWNSCKESLDQNMSFLSEDSFLSPLFGGVSHKAGTLGVSREELCSPVLFQWLKYDIKWEPWVQSVCCLWESHRQKAGMRLWGSTSLLTPGMTACLLSVTQGLCFLMKLFSTWNRICELGVGFLDIFGKGQIASEPASRLLLRNLRQRHRLTWWPLPRWVGDHGVFTWDFFVPVSATPASWAVSAMIAYWTH